MATAEENLRNQFQLLQDQQQKKLMRRKQRREEQKRAHTASVISTSSAASSAFGVTDQMDLKLAEPVKANSYLSEELVEHLNEQIRELKDENGRVYKLLSERDFELRQLKRKREEEKTAIAATGGPVTNETAATKIVDLSKKVRELTAEVESEKTKSKQLMRKCMEMQQQINNSNQDNKSIRASTISLRSSMDEKQDDPSELKQLQDKLKQMESKVVDYRNNNSQLKQELRLAHKALSQEVGENISVQSCLNGTTNWKGRAEQILHLQQKNEALKQEVGRLQGDNLVQVELQGTRKKTAVDRHKEQLKKIEKEKKEAHEKLASEKSALEEENFALKHKFEASKTRNAVLSNEIKGLKKQIPSLLQKNEHDNELIEALMREQTSLKQKLGVYQKNEHNLKLEAASKITELREQTTLKQKLGEYQKNEHNLKLESASKLTELESKQQQDTNIVEQLKTIVADKETKVHVLENEIQQLKLAHIQRSQVNKLFHTPQPPQPLPGGQQQQGPELVSLVNQGPVPGDSRPSTGFETIDLQYNVDEGTPPESRLSQAPGQTLDTTAPYSATPSRGPSRGQSRGPSRNRPPTGQRPSSASQAGVQAVSDLQYQCQEYKIVAQVAEVERDKLMEFMKVLQARLDESNSKVQDHQRDLVEQRRRNAMLEKQLGKASLNTARGGTGNSSARRKGTGKSALMGSVTSLQAVMETEEIGNMSIEELATNLEIQRDENEALKAALQSTLKAKEEDLRVYSDTIEETKTVFLQALRQYKQNVTGT